MKLRWDFDLKGQLLRVQAIGEIAVPTVVFFKRPGFDGDAVVDRLLQHPEIRASGKWIEVFGKILRSNG